MPSDTPHGPLGEIERTIDLAQSFVAGFSYEGFCADRRTVYAVRCCLAIIADASRKLPDDLKARYPGLPWPDIVEAGSIYRPDPDDVPDPLVWRTVREGLKALGEAVHRELERLSPVPAGVDR